MNALATNWDALCFNIATLIAGVFVLDYGADKFIDHTVIVGRRLGISPTLIALLTAGAEYEEVLVPLTNPLALGNVMGSSISNILGAFSLGLLCQPGGMNFDASAKMYSVLLLAVTTLFVAVAYFRLLNRVTGGILIGVFALYVITIGYAIYTGVTEPSQLSNSETDSDSDDESPTAGNEQPTSQTPLLGNSNQPQSGENKKPPQPLYQLISQLVVGLLALSLSGYIIAHSAGAIADSLQLSGTVFGLTVIAFATTLPEKLISVLSSIRGQSGIVVATTAGSNIFLLTLCVGVVAVAGIPVDQPEADTFVLFDLVVVWISSVCFTAVVFSGSGPGMGRGAGLVLLVAYVVFLVLEFTVFRR
ncbi:Sodium/calcium exchanger protein-domain-containing protein [Aspergillus aurantiobrunneus]